MSDVDSALPVDTLATELSAAPSEISRQPWGGAARAALEHRPFRRVLFGAFVSHTGSWMQDVVLAAFAYDLTGSATFVGLIVFAQLGPMLLLGLVGGLLADLIDRRRLIVGISLLQSCIAIGLAALTAQDHPSRLALVAVVFANGCAHAVYMPTFQALIPQLVDRRSLVGAIALNSTGINASRAVGPLIGSAVFATAGPSLVFCLNAASYLFVVGAIASVRLPEPMATNEAGGWHRLVAGFAVARKKRVVRLCLLTSVSFSLVCLPFNGQLPVIAERNLGIEVRSGSYGALYACFAVGAMLGALSVGTVLSARSRPRIARCALATFSFFLFGFALLRAPLLAYPLITVVGFAFLALTTSLSTILQEQLEDKERGRVLALAVMASAGVVPIGNLLGGALIESTSASTLLVVGSISAGVLSLVVRLDSHSRHAKKQETSIG